MGGVFWSAGAWSRGILEANGTLETWNNKPSRIQRKWKQHAIILEELSPLHGEKKHTPRCKKHSGGKKTKKNIIKLNKYK